MIRSSRRPHEQMRGYLSGPLLVAALAVFTLGILVGKWQERRAVGTPPPPPPSPQHGSVLHLQDLPFQTTSHAGIQKKQFLQPFEIPNLSGFQVATLHQGESVSIHQHKTMHEVFYVLWGKGTFTINGVDHPASEGTMVHLVPGEKHGIQSDEGELILAYFGITVGDEK
ncbi:AraC-like ligand binding domain [Seminavis robusta]|uniref:AraC-like ligand binding domain n=1 Tax=Seminavis robusta TaxID=568900 RepID=A0A9N8HU63_9STRA|nr:AraC-like ligand binding domain [Seminavis robusta]|eukprot:Sro1351_g265230.1 AraC-like ligand binding domain (169) ;mRNA; f:13860-14366